MAQREATTYERLSQDKSNRKKRKEYFRAAAIARSGIGSRASECSRNRHRERKPLRSYWTGACRRISAGVRQLDRGAAPDGGLAEAARNRRRSNAIDGSVLDSGIRNSGTSRVSGVFNQRAGHQKPTGTQDRCTRMSMAAEAAYLRAAAELVSADGGNSSSADDLAFARPAGEACIAGDPTHAEGVDNDECADRQCHQRHQRCHWAEDYSSHFGRRTGSIQNWPK